MKSFRTNVASRISLAIFCMAVAITLVAPAPARAQDSWTTSNFSCSGLLPPSERTAHGQILIDTSPEGGTIESVWTSAKAVPFECSWYGFPNVVTTEPTVLSFGATAYSNFNGPDENGSCVFLIGEAGATSPLAKVSAPYKGTYQLVLPAGTNLSNIFIQGSVYAGTGIVGDQGGLVSDFNIGSIVIKPQ